MSAGIHLSVVSHAQGGLVHLLLQDLQRYCAAEALQVTLTLNQPERLPFSPTAFRFPLHIIDNLRPRGFSANHNAAFARSARDYPCRYFCVVNPDVRLTDNPFVSLCWTLEADGGIGLVAPRVLGPDGRVEDSARRLPTPLSIARKALGGERRADYILELSAQPVDWVAGILMLLPAEVFAAMGGLDERHFLYYEDVNLCCRLRLAGYQVVLDPGASIVHDARRTSHRDLRYLRWHIASMARFFASALFVRCWWRLRSARPAPRR